MSTFVPKIEELPCGGRAIPELENMAFRCDICFAVVGSIGMPRECAELLEEKRKS